LVEYHPFVGQDGIDLMDQADDGEQQEVFRQVADGPGVLVMQDA